MRECEKEAREKGLKPLFSEEEGRRVYDEVYLSQYMLLNIRDF